ncbi:27956_t:CDS:2, partial [Racocetra persica]
EQYQIILPSYIDNNRMMIKVFDNALNLKISQNKNISMSSQSELSSNELNLMEMELPSTV